MLNYESQVKPLLDEGKTSQQIANYYKDKTAKSVPCSSVKVLLEENGLVIEDPVTRVRSGSLITYYSGLPDGNAKTLLGWFISHVFGRGESIASDTQPRATQVIQTIASLPGPMQAIGIKIIELGGGQPYDGLTAEMVDEIISDYTIRQAGLVAVGTINSKAGNAMAAAQAALEQKQTPEQILAAGEAAWSA